MTIVKASAATEPVLLYLLSDQIDFALSDGANATVFSWITSAGDDIEAIGSGMDELDRTAGRARRIDIDLSNDDIDHPDVTFSGITARAGDGGRAPGRMSQLTAGNTAFLTELLSFDDTMTGSDRGDWFMALRGDDVLRMGAGDDDAEGGAGDDRIRGEGGQDLLLGGSGNDIIACGSGADGAIGGAGDDRIAGDVGNDEIRGSAGDDTLRGDRGSDALEGNDGADRIRGGAGQDFLLGSTGADLLAGDPGDDLLLGGAGRDTALGGDGADELDGEEGADRMDGGEGDDLYLVDDRRDIAAEDRRGGGDDEVRATATHELGSGIEDLYLEGALAINGAGNALANLISGNAAGNLLSGGSGADSIFGEGGDDVLSGGNGRDRLFGGNGDDRMFGGSGDDELTGDGSGVETLQGGPGDDVLAGFADADFLHGGEGRDSYRFDSTTDSSPVDSDRILGFDRPGGRPGDLIHLAFIDASDANGRQAFDFSGVLQPVDPPLDEAGSLYLRNEAGETIVYGNVDADPDPELRIRILDGTTAHASDYSAADFDL